MNRGTERAILVAGVGRLWYRQFVCLDGRAADNGPTKRAESAGEMDVRKRQHQLQRQRS